MVTQEGPIDMARRHVQQGERHILGQLRVIERLAAYGLDTGEAERLLARFEATRESHLRHLSEMLDEKAAGRRDDQGNLLPFR